MSVRLLEERRFDAPRSVEVEHNGAWWSAQQSARRLCEDGRRRMADVRWSELHEWGLGTYRPMVPPERVRPAV